MKPDCIFTKIADPMEEIISVKLLYLVFRHFADIDKYR